MSLTDLFNGVTDAAPNSTNWTRVTSGSGTAALNGTGALKLRSVNAADAAFVYRPISVNGHHRYKIQFHVGATEQPSSLGQFPLFVTYGATAPSVTTWPVAYKLCLNLIGTSLYIMRKNSSNVAEYWTGSAWQTNTSFVTIVADVKYGVVVDTTSTGISLSIIRYDNGTIVRSFTEQAHNTFVSDSGSQNYIVLGEMTTNYVGGTIYIDTYREDEWPTVDGFKGKLNAATPVKLTIIGNSIGTGAYADNFLTYVAWDSNYTPYNPATLVGRITPDCQQDTRITGWGILLKNWLAGKNAANVYANKSGSGWTMANHITALTHSETAKERPDYQGSGCFDAAIVIEQVNDYATADATYRANVNTVVNLLLLFDIVPIMGLENIFGSNREAATETKRAIIRDIAANTYVPALQLLDFLTPTSPFGTIEYYEGSGATALHPTQGGHTIMANTAINLLSTGFSGHSRGRGVYRLGGISRGRIA